MKRFTLQKDVADVTILNFLWMYDLDLAVSDAIYRNDKKFNIKFLMLCVHVLNSFTACFMPNTGQNKWLNNCGRLNWILFAPHMLKPGLEKA